MPTATSTHGFPLDRYKTCTNIPRNEVSRASKTAPIKYRDGGVTVARVHTEMVVKFGHDVGRPEAENMRFVAHRTDILLPTVMDAWEEPSEDKTEERDIGYITMTYVEGDILSEAWPKLHVHARENIYHQLLRYISQLHLIQLNTPGPIGGGISHSTLFTNYGAGPFYTVEELEAWFNERLVVCQQFGRAPHEQPTFTGQLRPLVMCHLDLFPRNMILDLQGRVWLLDWEYAGAYPEHFENAVLAKEDSDFSRGLLQLLGHSETTQEKVGRLSAIGFALSTAGVTRPTGYRG